MGTHIGNTGFVIRRLNKNCYERQDARHPARSPLYCFFYLQQGTVLVDIEDTTYFIQEDDLVIVPAGRAFRVRYYENSKGYMGGFDAANFIQIAGWRNPKLQLDSQSSGRIAMLLERLCQESELQQPDEVIIGAYLQALLAEADSIYKKENSQTVRHNDSVCDKFLELLFHNKAEGGSLQPFGLSVTYCAEKLNITPNHLNKVVKRVTGKSPSVWIEELVIQEAKRLLRTTSLPLGEIATMVGIHDQSYFARRFKKHEGISPSIFRKND